MKLKNIPVGTIVHNVELKPGKGGQMIRSAVLTHNLWVKKKNMLF